MAKCSVCGRDAIYLARYEGRAYCREHFLKWFDSRVRSTIRRYNYFGSRENIVVAVSGGKDSLSALKYIVDLSEHAPGWNISALLIDEGIAGYRNITKKDFMRVVKDLGVDWEIRTFKEEVGKPLDRIVKAAEKKHLPYTPCTYCGVFRRYIMNKAAREMGASVVVTAHNLDDIVQTFVMNIARNDWRRISRLAPVTGTSEHPKFVKKVKLFYKIPEKEVVIYSLLNGVFPETFVECPYAPRGMRWDIRDCINAWEEKRPGVKYSILGSLEAILPVLKRMFPGRPNTCKICGEPSTGEVCRACELKQMLGLL